MIGIYKIENLVNGKIYIGQSNDIGRRFNEHKRRDGQLVDKAIKKYGISNFSFSVVEECSVEELSNRESYWINYYDCIVPQGYNFLDVKSAYGEFNPASKLTDGDILFIRKCYKDKIYPTAAEFRRQHFPNLSSGTIEGIFYGRSWPHIMPEIYTKELKEHYSLMYLTHAVGYRKKGQDNPAAILEEKDVLKMRIMYEKYDRNHIFKQFPHYTQRAVVSIISGQNWKHLPIYKKREKRWVYPENWSDNMKKEFNTYKKEVMPNEDE